MSVSFGAFASRYDFLSPQRIVFGWGRRREVGTLARSLGRRAFVVHGSRTLERTGVLASLLEDLRAAGLSAELLGSVTREPEIDDVDRLAESLRSAGAGAGDLVVAIGGGSAIDLAKAGCAMAVNRESPTVKDYLEGVGKGLTLVADPLPLLAMPTTAGTGSEATKNAVISSQTPPFKKSLRSDRMVPRIVLVDPELQVSVPRETTAYTGMDAITQLIESYVSVRAAPLPQALCLHGLSFAGDALERVLRDPGDRQGREQMAHAALLSGIALANSGLGLAHGVAAALGIIARVAHGLACAVLLPVALRVNLPVRGAELARLGEAITGRSYSSAEQAAGALIERVEHLCDLARIPRRLRDLGVRREDLEAIARSSYGNSMSGNPRQLETPELLALLQEIL